MHIFLSMRVHVLTVDVYPHARVATAMAVASVGSASRPWDSPAWPHARNTYSGWPAGGSWRTGRGRSEGYERNACMPHCLSMQASCRSACCAAALVAPVRGPCPLHAYRSR